MSTLMGTTKSQLLSKAHPLSAQSPPRSNCWGAETPMSKSHSQKWPIFAWKKIWVQFLHGGCRGGSKAPRYWKTKQIGPLSLAPHGFDPKYFNPPLGFHGHGVGQRGLGGQDRFMLGCSPFANTVQGKWSEAVFWPGDISADRLPDGLALLLAHGQP